MECLRFIPPVLEGRGVLRIAARHVRPDDNISGKDEQDHIEDAGEGEEETCGKEPRLSGGQLCRWELERTMEGLMARMARNSGGSDSTSSTRWTII